MLQEKSFEDANLSRTDFLILSEISKDFQSINKKSIDLIEDAIKLQIITKAEVADILEQKFNLKFAKIEGVQVSSEIKSKISEALCLKELFLPFFEDEKEVHVVVRDILEENKLQDLEKILETEKKIILFFERTSVIQAFIIKQFRYKNAFAESVHPLQFPLSSKSRSEVLTVKDPIVNFTENLFEEAFFSGASQVHFDAMEYFVKVYFEKEDFFENSYKINKENWVRILNRLKLLFGLKVSEIGTIQKSDVKIKVKGVEIIMQICVYPSFFGENITIKVIRQPEILNLEEYSISKTNLQKILKFTEKSEGTIIITGEETSGTKLLYSLGETFIKKGYKVCVIEKEGLTGFANFVKVNSVEAATLSGASVFLFSDESYLKSLKGKKNIALIGFEDVITVTKKYIEDITCAIHQKTLRKLCKCKVEVELKTEDFTLLRLAKTDVKKIYKRAGCEDCNYSGYLGQVLSLEVLLNDLETQEIFEENKSKKAILEGLKRKGFSTIFEDARLKILQGITDTEEVKRVIGI